jgi:hypothetical protein
VVRMSPLSLHCRGLKENDADSWMPVQSWVHHGGKSGQPAEQGARFEVHFEKSRGFYGPDAEPFETRLIGEQWIISPIKSGDDLDTLKALRKQGMSVRDIADRTGLSKSSVQRRLEGGDDD